MDGIDNLDSGMGCYAMKPGDFNDIQAVLLEVIGDYHKKDPECALTHVNDWDASASARAACSTCRSSG